MTNSTDETVDLLTGLLAQLYPDPPPDILTLADVKRRYRLTGLGPLAVSAIQQAQRINRAAGKFENTGLCEFHIGLIYLHWHDFQGAASQFKAARQQWSFVDKTAAMSLAHLAEGLAEHLRYAHETALEQYGKAERLNGRIRFNPSSSDQGVFWQQLTDVLEQARTASRAALWEPAPTFPVGQIESDDGKTAVNDEIPDGETAVPPPILSSHERTERTNQSPTPLPDHTNNNNEYIWYRIRVQKPDRLFPRIQKGYILVHRQTAQHNFEKGELMVIQSNDPNASIVLEPFLPTEQAFPRIILARAEFEGHFIRDNQRVQFSSDLKQIPVTHEDLFGYVVGLWLEAEDFGILT